MSPKKVPAAKPKPGATMSTPKKDNTTKMTPGSLAAKREWRRVPVANATPAMYGSPSPSTAAKKEKAKESDEDSDDEEVVLRMNIKKLSMSDETGVDVLQTPTGRYTTDEKYIIKKAKKFSPGWGSFVQRGEASDDPFSSAYRPPQRRQHKSHSVEVTPSSQRRSSRIQGNWRSGGSGSRISDSPTHGNQNLRIEATGSNTRVSGQNAQSFYSPSACVFVANLSSTETETELEAAVTKTFRKYGTVFVKIRRDNKNMPFAFCQFTDDADALRAMEDGRGRLIHGRPVRTELAKANRTFSFRRVNGEHVSVEEGRAILEHYGVIDNAWYPTEEQILGWNLNGAILVQFKFFDDGRKAQQGIRNDGVYLLESTANLFQASPLSAVHRHRAIPDPAQEYIKEYERDRNSVFVGNIPQGYTKAKLRAIFEPYGVIVDIVIHEKPSDRADEMFLYGFVEYEDSMAAQRAIKARNNFPLEGRALRVSQKNSEYRASGSRSFSAFGTPVIPANHSSRVNQHLTSPQHGYVPYPYGYLPTPPYYPYPYPSAWSYHWGGSSPYGHPQYHGFATGSPTPNTNAFYQAYPSQIDYHGHQPYPQAPYYPYGSYTSHSPMVEAIPEDQSQALTLTSTDHVNTSAEEQNLNAQ